VRSPSTNVDPLLNQPPVRTQGSEVVVGAVVVNRGAVVLSWFIELRRDVLIASLRRASFWALVQAWLKM
jgi:hypothetical protein